MEKEQMKRTRILLIIISTLLTSTLGQTNSPIPEQLKLKSTIRRLNLEVLNPKIPYEVTSNDVKSTWNAKILEEFFNKNQPLSKNYKGATTLKFDSYDGFNQLIAYNKKMKKCVFTIWWDRAKFWERDFYSLEEDCKNLRITKINRKENEGFMISYIDFEKGNFNWFFLTSHYERSLRFNTLDVGFYEKGFLSKNQLHDIFNYGYNNDKAVLIVYQRNCDSKFNYPEKNFGLIVFKSGKFDNKETPEFVESKINPLKIGKDAKLEAKILTIRFLEDFSNNSEGFFGISMQYKNNLVNDLKFYTVNPKNDIITSENLEVKYFHFSSMSELKFSNTVNNFLEGSISYYLEAEGNKGSIGICKPVNPFFKNLGPYYDYSYNCLTKFSEAHHLKDNEIFERISANEHFIITNINDLNNGILSRQIITKYLSWEIPSEVDTEKKLYSCSKKNLIEVPKDFPETAEPFISYYFKPEYGDYRNLTLVNDDLGKKEELEFTIMGEKSKLQVSWVDQFTQNEVKAETQIITLKKSQAKNVVYDYDKSITLKGDFVDLRPDIENPNWFTFTPMKVISKPNPPKIIMNEFLRRNLQDFSITDDPLYFCSTSDYKFYSKNRKIHSFSFKNKYEKDDKYMLIDLEFLDIGASSISKCVSINNLNLFLLREGKTYTAISLDFSGEGEYLVRRFYSELNILNITGGSKDNEKKSYRLEVYGGGIVEICFETAFPLVKVDSEDTKSGKIKVFESDVEFQVNWVE